MQRFYEEGEAEEILRRALVRGHEGGMTLEQLQLAAAELGISPDALAAAADEHNHMRALEADRREFQRERTQGFWSNLGSYVVINTALLLFDWWPDKTISWAFWPLIGWGIGIAMHMLSLFRTTGEEYENNFVAWRRRRKRLLQKAREREELSSTD